MLKGSKSSQLHLPILNQKVLKPHPETQRLPDCILESSLEKENEKTCVDLLDHWTARTSESGGKPKLSKLNSLYRQSISKKPSKMNGSFESSLLT